jgi:5'/3'-nucleotidase SurE
MKNLNILLVNDDGFQAEGIEVIFDALQAAGHDVTLVAPKQQQSGIGTLINVDKIFRPLEIVNFAPDKWYVDASPIVTTWTGLDVILAENKPDLVISGINEGANVGQDTAISSGTLSAAAAAIHQGIPTIAVSAGTGSDEQAYTKAYEIGADLVLDLIDQLEREASGDEPLLPEGVGLSVNIPTEFPAGISEVQGVVYTHLDEVSTINFGFGALPLGLGAGLTVTLTDTIPPEAISNLDSEGQQFLSGKITITPIDDDWSGSEQDRQDISDRYTQAPNNPTTKPLNILITNDDGFEGEGIKVLYDSLTDAGHNVTLIAPKEQQSGQGTVLNVNTIFQPTEIVNFADNQWYVGGGPRKTTWAALDYILEEKPDLVISGINEGENIGPGGAISSGTVSSAITALLRDVPAIAISAGIDFTDPSQVEKAYEVGADFLNDLIPKLQATQGSDPEILPDGVGLSINIPVRFPDGVEEIQGVKFVESSGVEPLVIDVGPVVGGSGLRVSPGILPNPVEPISEGGQFLSGFITVLTLDGDWTAPPEISAQVRDLIEPLLTPLFPPDVFGTTGNDSFDSVLGVSGFVGDKQNLFTSSGNDTVDVSFASGNNRIDLGSGDDLIFAGSNNRILAGSGNDRIFLSYSTGNNVVTGGSGADQFWLVTDAEDLPLQPSVITDFSQGVDVLGFGGTDLGFSDLVLSQSGTNTIVKALGRELAILQNVQASSLTANNFVFA